MQYQEDLIAFVYNVLDDEDEALLLIDETERRMEASLKYLANIRKDIESK